MKLLTLGNSTLVALTVALLVGCGGDEPAQVEIETDVGPGTAQTTAKKTSAARSVSSSSGSGAAVRSAMDQIDDALDNGSYMTAVNIAIKAGKSQQENMETLRYVQKALGDPMARGDAKAIDAYQKLNTFYIMKYQR